ELAVLLPYDTNWQCRVNGKRQETERFLGEFMKIRLPASGEAVTVDLKYRPAGLYAGCAVLLLCFAVLAVLLLGGAGLIRLPDTDTDKRRWRRDT
ncbi:MAG: YfhO family protein, partial [Lachnospiraceae bacterium]|nr:YfhO family protein [Lachnospiraceae bacterium]